MAQFVLEKRVIYLEVNFQIPRSVISFMYYKWFDYSEHFLQNVHKMALI